MSILSQYTAILTPPPPSLIQWIEDFYLFSHCSDLETSQLVLYTKAKRGRPLCRNAWIPFVKVLGLNEYRHPHKHTHIWRPSQSGTSFCSPVVLIFFFSKVLTGFVLESKARMSTLCQNTRIPLLKSSKSLVSHAHTHTHKFVNGIKPRTSHAVDSFFCDVPIGFVHETNCPLRTVPAMSFSRVPIAKVLGLNA